MTDAANDIEVTFAQMRDAFAGVNAKLAEHDAWLGASKALLLAHRASQQANETHLKAIMAYPGLTQTPAELVAAVNRVAAEGRTAANAEVQAHLNTVKSIVGAVRTRDKQSASLFLARSITLLALTVATLLATSTWHYRAVANTPVAADPVVGWDAGQRAMAAADPKAWSKMVRGWNIPEAHLAAIEACQARANTFYQAQTCSLIVAPDGK